MLKDLQNNKTTPKRKAQDLIMDALATKLGYWAEYEADGMTKREVEQVQEQLKKEADRIAKRFGFDSAWIS